MDTSPITSSGHEQRVTASELVRHFGIWQDRAAHAPVYILHRGRPRLVLTSLDIMEALCAPLAASDSGDAARLESLLGATHEIVLWLNRDGTVVPASRAARTIFGNGAQRIDRIAAIGGGFLAATADRVLASGIEDSVEITPAHYPARRWSCRIEAAGDGAILVARDITDDDALAAARVTAAAEESAMLAARGVATVHIGLRGYLAAPSATFIALTGVDADSLANARFVTLFEIGSRVAVGDAIEGVIETGGPQSLEARLLVNRRDPIAVTAAFSAARRGAAIEGVHALVVQRGEYH